VMDPTVLGWYQAAVRLRALLEVSAWTHSGQQDSRGGHPWQASAPAFAARLTAVTGVRVNAL
jgi:hypothetical protein